MCEGAGACFILYNKNTIHCNLNYMLHWLLKFVYTAGYINSIILYTFWKLYHSVLESR